MKKFHNFSGLNFDFLYFLGILGKIESLLDMSASHMEAHATLK